jgi:signal transduction histidine kinase
MNGVLGMVDVLERHTLTEDQRRIVVTMRQSARALLRIIDDVLDFSKIEAGRLELEAIPFSLSGLDEGVLDRFRPQVLRALDPSDYEADAAILISAQIEPPDYPWPKDGNLHKTILAKAALNPARPRVARPNLI